MRQWAERLTLALAATVVAFSTGCSGFFVSPNSVAGGGSGSGTGSTTSDYVYVANATTQNLAGFAVGTATLTAVTGSPFALGYTPKAMAVNPADSILFISGYNNAGTGLVYAYAIGTGGALNILNNGSPVESGFFEVSLAISPDGQWLMGLDADNASVDEFQINSSTGVLTGPTLQGYTDPSASNAVNASQVAFSPNGTLLFAALGTAGDLVYTFNTSSGVLTQMQALALSTNSSDNALTVSPNGNYLYVARSGVNGGLAAFAIGTNGALSELTSLPYTAGNQPYSVVTNLAGTEVYVANRSDSTVSGYAISSTGTLTALSGSSYKSGSAVTALLADKSGSYLLAAANGGTPDLTLSSFDSTGNLVAATTAATGSDPTGAVAIAGTH